MKTRKSSKKLRDAFLEIGALIPVTDEEVEIFENAQQVEIEKESESLDEFDSILRRGQEILSGGEPMFCNYTSNNISPDVAMAARDGKDIPEHIRKKMLEAKLRLKKD